jgi:hypothetical protein
MDCVMIQIDSKLMSMRVKTPWLDKMHVIFGEVADREYMHVVKQVERLGTASGKPKETVVITDCGGGHEYTCMRIYDLAHSHWHTARASLGFFMVRTPSSANISSMLIYPLFIVRCITLHMKLPSIPPNPRLPQRSSINLSVSSRSDKDSPPQK